MKILAVRGKNLASLAGRFEVDFSKPPLEHAGLIAITGPTGAGKTTLLDAMCLALFDRTPRFGNRGGVVIGGQSDDPNLGLKANDVRGILRHGAVEGWAEVDFIGVDEQRWRARWDVRRARNRVEGRIQSQHMALIDPLTERSVGGDRKSDVLEAIERRLGLDFDQFCRSVLLAQGEFAAFLEASGNERAELLERMTGTGLYRQLGRAAFERAKQAEAELALIQRERAALPILPDEERAQLEVSTADRRAVATTLDGQASAVEAGLRWYAREAELASALAAAHAGAQAGVQAQAELGETEQLLARVERVAGIRERVAERDRLTIEHRTSATDLEFLRGEIPLIEAQLGELQAKVARCEQARVRARERRRRLAPELDRARELDGQSAATRAERERLITKQLAAREQLRASDAQLAQLDTSLAEARARLERLTAELRAAAGIEPLAVHWPHYKSLIQQQLRALEQRARCDRRGAELRPTRERLETERSEATTRLAQALAQRSQARQQLDAIASELDQRASLADLSQRQQVLERCRERVMTLRVIIQASEQIEAQRLAFELERSDSITERDHRAAEQRRVEAELARAESVFEEAQRGLRQLEAVRDLVSHRADLRRGEACPLCGATDHPAADEGAPVDAVLEAQRRRIDGLLVKRDSLQHELGVHQSGKQLANERLANLDRRRTKGEQARELAQANWTEAIAHEPSSFPDRVDSSDAKPAVEAAHDQLVRAWQALAEQRREVERRVESQRALVARCEQADREHDHRRTRLEAIEREREAVVRELDELRTRLEALTNELAERETELADVGPHALVVIAAAEPDSQGFTAVLERRGGELVARLDAAVRGFQSTRTQHEQTREGLRLLDSRRLELGSEARARRERCEQLRAELSELERILGEHARARAGVLDGRPVADVSRELEAVVELAERDHEAAKDEQARVERELKVQLTRAHNLAEQVEGLRERRDEAAGRASLAQAEAGIGDAELAGLLDRSELWREGWISATRARVSALRADLERIQAVIGERERVLAAHRERERPSLEQAAAEQLRRELEQRRAALQRELFELEHRLRRDSDDRAEAQRIAPRLRECEQAAAIWGQLRDAIGSATGDKFQKFAQSLTLELLLIQANAQLRELKPRYALGRVPKYDLELQLVDHDLGDEIRSIRGLSGGEKFLVSLALALALASLSAEDCRIDSLFIDEGFGTLDSHSLDIAVSTLDTLQGEGRQIGVISHVPGLAERVGVEIRVEPVSSGRSRVIVRS